MSWRETLGITNSKEIPNAHNSHNTQKPSKSAICADIADSAYGDSKQEHSRLLETLADACQGLSISAAEVQKALAPEDIDDWRNGIIGKGTLAAFARSLLQLREMERGLRPAHYTEHATCKQCGPIWLWTSGDLLGCPWCRNRFQGLPIPRRGPVRCVDCRHWTPDAIGDGSGIGSCATGGPPRGQMPAYPRVERKCDLWLPVRGLRGESSNDR